MLNKLSIIIPCYCDEAALSALLPKIYEAGKGYDIEIIVVDGAQSDTCAQTVHSFDALCFKEEASRGKQIIKGIEAASGDAFWVLHADAVIEQASISAIWKAVQGGAGAGCFRFSFAGYPTLAKRFIAFWVNIRARIGGVAYGDQGIFIKADLYEALGGYEPLPLFEEVRLVRRLKQQKSFEILDNKIYVSPRRWERDGFFKRTILNRMYAIAYQFGVSAQTVSKWYRTPKTSHNSDLHDSE
jgi:rSAM/selenodomain-associated transferase 2